MKQEKIPQKEEIEKIEKIEEAKEAPKEKGIEEELEKFSVSKMEQMTTRGDGTLEKKENFETKEIDFGSSLEHLRIHHEGEVAGSQFNGELFKEPEDVEKLLRNLLPEELSYDQFDRAEITLDVSYEGEKPIGWSGVKNMEEVKEKFPEAEIKKEMRFGGGEMATEEGVEGMWYPEMERDETGKFVVAKDKEGNIKNPKGKFEPHANIAYIPKSKFEEISQTEKITVVIQKDKENEKPMVLTVFPGDNAPAFPAKINAENFKLDTLKDTKEEKYWENNVFIKTKE